MAMEAMVMIDTIVGIVGVALIVYLFCVIVRPEKF
jgi:K+-transporting ATPase KdpF subunit